MSEGLMTKEDSLYFTQCFNDSQRNGQITFDQFSFICSEYKKFDQAVLQETLKDLKTNLDKKNNNAQIILKQDEYFNYVNTVLKDQAQSKNQNDPEMEKLFKSLAGKEGDYVYKNKLSHIIRTFHLPITISNCSNNYGPRQFPEKLIPLMVVRALRGDYLPIYGDGMQIRDWLYVDDHCSAIDLIVRRGKIGESYNVGAVNEQHNIDIVRLICSVLDDVRPAKDGQSYSRLIKHIEDRPGHDRRYAIDSSKITGTLGWKPAFTFSQAMRSTIEWYLSNQEWVDEILSGKYNTERLGLTQSYHPSD